MMRFYSLKKRSVRIVMLVIFHVCVSCDIVRSTESSCLSGGTNDEMRTRLRIVVLNRTPSAVPFVCTIVRNCGCSDRRTFHAETIDDRYTAVSRSLSIAWLHLSTCRTDSNWMENRTGGESRSRRTS